MPRKTRKEKLRTHDRKLHNVPHVDATTTYNLQATTYFLTDFKKSLFVIVGIFSLEILVYFASMSNYVSKLIR